MNARIDDVAYARTLAELLPRPIRDDAENERATKLLMALDEIDEMTPEQEAGSELLAMLITAYEERFALNASTPLSLLQELMVANDLKAKDIAPILGGRGTASNVLSGRREISKNMARRLGERFGVSHTLFL